MSKRIRLLLIIICILLIAFVVFMAVTIHYCNKPRTVYPTDGVWFCEELGIQIHFGEVNDNFIKKANAYIYCQPEYNKGSSLLAVKCQDTDSDHYELDETVFAGKYVSGDTESFSLREKNGTSVYTFIRQDNYESSPATQFLIVNANCFSVEEINSAIKSTFSGEMLTRGRDVESTDLFFNTEWLFGKMITYDLYCLNENRTILDIPYYENEMYLYIVITEIESEEKEWTSKNHIFGFCVTDKGMESSLYDEIHSTDKDVSALLLQDSQKLGSFTMNIESVG